MNPVGSHSQNITDSPSSMEMGQSQPIMLHILRASFYNNLPFLRVKGVWRENGPYPKNPQMHLPSQRPIESPMDGVARGMPSTIPPMMECSVQ